MSSVPVADDAVDLSQSGSTITVKRHHRRRRHQRDGPNMNSVEADGSQAGYDDLDAYGHDDGCLPERLGIGNSFTAEPVLTRSSAAPATTTSTPAITATFSTSAAATATTTAPASNSLVYPAQPNDNVALVWLRATRQRQVVYGDWQSTGTSIPFGIMIYWTNIGSIEIQDGCRQRHASTTRQEPDAAARATAVLYFRREMWFRLKPLIR